MEVCTYLFLSPILPTLQTLFKWVLSKGQEITSVGEYMEKRKPSHTVGRNVNWCHHYRKQYEYLFKKLKIELPSDPAILLMGIYLKKYNTLLWKDICTPILIIALLSIAKI